VTDAPMTHRELDIVRVFDAPRAALWRAWTDPDQLSVWWGPAGMRTPRESVEMDVRPGGVFRLTMITEDGTAFTSDMRYTRVEEPAVLAFAWPAQRGVGAGSATITFTDLGDGRTEMLDHFAGDTTEVIAGYMEQGAGQQYDKLAAHVARA
jgi:uncharacterized protein YndB with AHSA1/START domain